MCPRSTTRARRCLEQRHQPPPCPASQQDSRCAGRLLPLRAPMSAEDAAATERLILQEDPSRGLPTPADVVSFRALLVRFRVCGLLGRDPPPFLNP